MSAPAYSNAHAYTELTCGECGIVFAVPSRWYEARALNGEAGREFHCPNGHSAQAAAPTRAA
jgi:hypothetical protein